MSMSLLKRFPTRQCELKRWWYDRRRDKALETVEGRDEYWNHKLPRSASQRSMIALLEESLALEGDVIECGVYRGSSLMRMARTMHSRAPNKRLYGLDSFDGFPPEGIRACDVGDTSARLRKMFEMFDVNGEIVPGFFADTLRRFADHQFCFVHLDCDSYTSYQQCLQALYDRITPGRVIVFDECDTGAWPGSILAIKEFFQDRQENVQICLDRRVPAYFVRRPSAQQHAAA